MASAVYFLVCQKLRKRALINVERANWMLRIYMVSQPVISAFLEECSLFITRLRDSANILANHT
jgi:hypothetical protein